MLIYGLYAIQKHRNQNSFKLNNTNYWPSSNNKSLISSNNLKNYERIPTNTTTTTKTKYERKSTSFNCNCSYHEYKLQPIRRQSTINDFKYLKNDQAHTSNQNTPNQHITVTNEQKTKEKFPNNQFKWLRKIYKRLSLN